MLLETTSTISLINNKNKRGAVWNLVELQH
jgi:hypothetical protein